MASPGSERGRQSHGLHPPVYAVGKARSTQSSREGYTGFLMYFLDLALDSLAANLALDEALLLEAEAGRGGEVLRVWEWSAPAVVLGAGCRLAEDVNEAACHADGVPIQRRASGGGTVLLGAGCLLYSLVLAYERSPFLREI